MSLRQNETQLVLENPFFHRGPIRNRRCFYGRTQETRQALHMLRHGQCVSIVGPRRIGKTSHLFHLCDPVVQRGHDLGQEYLFIYVDCQGLGDLDKLQFYQWLWSEAKRALAEQGDADGWAERVSSFRGFRDAMIEVQGKEYKPVFLFDEFDTIAQNPNLDQHLFSSLRSLAPTVVAYATVSQDSLFNLTYADRSVLSSPFFNIFKEIRLGFLRREEAEEMVGGLLRMAGGENLFTKENLAFVFEAGGRHPFFLQLACYHLFELKMERQDLTEADYERARQQYAEDAEAHFRYVWKNLDANLQQAVRLACEERVNQIGDEQKRWLENNCILCNNATFSSVFAEFVRSQAGGGLDPQAAGSTRMAEEPGQKPSEPTKCQLSINCSKHGWVSVRVVGSLSYDGDSVRPLEQGLVDRLNRRAIDALRLADWRFQVKEIGRNLFEELILNRPEIEKGYQRAMARAAQDALSLALHAPRHFLRLPFEALHSDDEGYLCLKFPMYHVVSGYFFDKELPSPTLIGELDSQGRRPRALVVASNTWGDPGSPVPGVEEEAGKVSTMLEEHGFDVCSLSTDEATEERVRDELRRGGYLLFHYAGHGSHIPDSAEENALYFWEGTKGKSEIRELTASQLALLVQNTPLQFAYLSSCWGAHTAPPFTLLDEDFLGVMDGLVMGGVPAVLGFRWPVSDNGAQLLAQSFYLAWLEGGNGLDRALYEARRTVADLRGRDERAWFSPILVMRASGF